MKGVLAGIGGSHVRPAPTLDPYDAWMAVNRPTERGRAALRAQLAELGDAAPLISVIVPVYNTPLKYLDMAIESVRAQIYSNWELCICDDASPEKKVAARLQEWAAKDDRIRLSRTADNGNISRATNAAVELATGEFLAFLDHDDELTEDALGEVALYLAAHPDTDLLYSDDDKIDANGRRFAPQFKPDWAPALLLSFSYTSHLMVTRRTLFQDLGGFRIGFEGSQDYDYVLRAGERARHVGHVPKILYHWRVLPGSTAEAGDAKSNAFDAGIQAVAEAAERQGLNAKAGQPDWALKAKVGIFDLTFGDEGPAVALIIPTKNQKQLLAQCITSLEKTTYKNYRVYVVDNDSDDADTLAYLDGLSHTVLRISNEGKPFSFARLNNQAVAQVSEEYVLFLNNDTEAIAPGWLSQMMGYAQSPGVGSVGARLLFGDGTIQHAGIVQGYYEGLAGPAFRNQPGHDWGYLGYAKVTREFSAVTAACLLTKRELFLSLGGFDEQNFAVAYNDVDFCYRLVEAGLRNLYCASAELYHHEGKSRGFKDNPRELTAFRRRYHGWRDRWYNPNLSLENERFEVAASTVPAPMAKPIKVLMWSHNLNHEGAPNSQFELTVGLMRRGLIDPIVVAPDDGPLRALYQRAGIEPIITPSGLWGFDDAASYEACVERIRTWIAGFGVELVYANTLETYPVITAAHRAGLPTLWNCRESTQWDRYYDNLPDPKLRTAAYAAFGYPYKTIFVARSTLEGWKPMDGRGSFTLVNNGLNRREIDRRAALWPRELARQTLGLRPDEIAVSLVGTVCDRKNQIDLVNAVGKLSEAAIARARIFVVGDRQGDYSHALHALRNALPAETQQRLYVVPETPHAALYYQASDIAICTSVVESYPRVVLEAMAYGLPLVTTPVFGIAEQVLPDVNALLYAPGETDLLAKHLESLIMNDDKRRELAENAAPVLDRLPDYEMMLDGYARLFQEAYFSHV
jgi:GT2 family glycosyltransferase